MPVEAVEIPVIKECANAVVARETLNQAARRAGMPDIPVTVTIIRDAEEAERRGFAGSPTFLIDGRDPFARPDTPSGLSCRVYATPAGLAGTPSIDQLRDALRRH